jgi:hypothetical protein
MLGFCFLLVGVVATPGWEPLTGGEVDIVLSQADSLYCSSAMEFGKSEYDRAPSVTKVYRNNLLFLTYKSIDFY